MSNINNDEKALLLLEKAVERAKVSLEVTQKFRPFMMILNKDGAASTIENQVEDMQDSYDRLGDSLKDRVKSDDIDVLVLAVDAMMPSRFGKGSLHSIRLHIEEQSQLQKDISARFIYLPYRLYSIEGKIVVELDTPVPVGFPAEYLLKNSQ
ncbi:MAG: hypothetical protein U9R27_12770, partial [Campylobacterota bacterium]|nr:hypothetical protein [Campylobacterota bacterium]